MKPYLAYTAEDFACDEEFLKWVKYPDRYPQLDSFWKQWLVENPHKIGLVDEARCLVRAVLADDEFLPDEEKQREVWQRIQRSTGLEPRGIVPLWKRWYSRAAVIVFCMVLSWTAFIRTGGDAPETSLQSSATGFVKHVNNADAPQTIVLSDGTSIVLQPHTILEYPRTFAPDLREVSLAGEAFFEVTRDADRPFMVRSGGITTRVLGTSFTVRNITGEGNVLVQVKTGKVSVFVDSQGSRSAAGISENNVEGVVLMPNQQVLYEKSAMKMTKSLVANPSVLIAPARRNFEFSDAPIKEVFRAIEEAYGVEIVFDEQALASCYLNASLDDVPLYDKLKLICKGINASYEIMDSHIIVYGKGCRADTENPNPN